MLRRSVPPICLLAWLAVAGLAPAEAEDITVLESAGRPLLYDYLISQVDEQAAAREAEVAQALASAAALEQRRRRLRADFRRLVGELPERTPLHAKTTGTIDCDGYRIEKVIFESRPLHHVTANLYLPDDTSRPLPGVLVPCGHSANGKASEFYQSVCVLLAKSGIVALIYDPIGQGERNQLPEGVSHGTNEHTLVGIGALLVGLNTGHYRIWDGLRSMDYLASRPEVDPTRLGCTGNSGGGTMTTWLMAADDRIAVAAPSCFITTIERLLKTIGPQDCEQHFPGQGKLGIDHTDFITMRAPKPTIILAAEQDFFDFRGTQDAYRQAADVYRVLGQPERVALFSYNDQHGFSQPRREAAVSWLRRWLADDERPVHEPTLSLQTDAALQVTETGQVVNDFADEVTVVDLNQQRAQRLTANRQAAWNAMTAGERVAAIKQTLGLPEKLSLDATTEHTGTLDRDGFRIEKLILQRPGEVPLPALLCLPDGSETRKLPAMLVADSRGKDAELAAGGPIEQLVNSGQVVISVDLRGYGETADTKEGAKYHNNEFRTAMVAMHVGRPLMGQRVEDLLTAFGVLAEHPRVDSRQIRLVGVGRAGRSRCTPPRSSRGWRPSCAATRSAPGPTTSSPDRSTRS